MSNHTFSPNHSKVSALSSKQVLKSLRKRRDRISAFQKITLDGTPGLVWSEREVFEEIYVLSKRVIIVALAEVGSI